MTEDRRDRLERMSRVVVRPIGSPLPLGMIALGAASVTLTGVQLRWLPSTAWHPAAMVVLVFTVPLQLLASVFGYLGRDGAGGTGLATLAGSWAVTGALVLSSPPGQRDPTLGLLLCFAAAAVLVPAAAAMTGKVSIGIAFVMAATRFALTGTYELGAGPVWQDASGWLGLALCVVALYCALATELEDTVHRDVLPVLRHGQGRKAVEGTLLEELGTVEREAGVRQQL